MTTPESNSKTFFRSNESEMIFLRNPAKTGPKLVCHPVGTNPPKTGSNPVKDRFRNDRFEFRNFLSKWFFLLFFVHLFPKLRTYFHVCLIDGAARIFSNLICRNWESNSRQLSCTSLRDLNSGRFTS